MRKSLLFLLMLPAACALGAQDQKAPARRAEPPDEGGIWPTRKMMDLMLARWGDMVSDHYELDEKQSSELTTKIKSRWSTFATENQKTLEPLLTDFIEMRLQMEPPTKEQVAEWSKRAGGALDLLEKEIAQGADEMRGILRDDQRAKFDGEMMGFQTGMQFARTQLNRWQQGEFQEREFWDPPLAVRRQRREAEQSKAKSEEEKAKAAAEKAAADAAGKVPGASMADGPPDQIASEVDAWTQHVEDFIKKYELDEAQKKSAYSILKELKERALAHRDANKPEIDKLERRIALGTGTPEELKPIEDQLVKLYGPIDAMFEELQRRIEPIPTAKQKAAARKREKAKEAEAKPSDEEKKEGEGKEESKQRETGGEKEGTGPDDERKPPEDTKKDTKKDTKQERLGSEDDAADAGPQDSH